MNKIILIALLIFIFINNAQTQPREILWSFIGQKYELQKGEDFFFVYDKNMPKTNCLYVEAIENMDKLIFELKTYCVPAPDTIIVPDIIVVGCDGEITREQLKTNQKGSISPEQIVKKVQEKYDKSIIWKKIGQKEYIKNCQSVTFVYSDDVPKEDIDFVYETVENGYMLTLVQKGMKQTLEFDCICKTFIASNPETVNLRVNKNLVYEQIIWTPLGQSFWEVRIGTTSDRNCKSPAREKLKNLREKVLNYEKNIPKCK